MKYLFILFFALTSNLSLASYHGGSGGGESNPSNDDDGGYGSSSSAAAAIIGVGVIGMKRLRKHERGGGEVPWRAPPNGCAADCA